MPERENNPIASQLYVIFLVVFLLLLGKQFSCEVCVVVARHGALECSDG